MTFNTPRVAQLSQRSNQFNLRPFVIQILKLKNLESIMTILPLHLR